MATRPAFFVDFNNCVSKKNFDFEFFPGFSNKQKQKTIKSFHNAIGEPTLEVSTQSNVPLGQKLSAFNLKLNGYRLENVFQSSKVFEFGGPYLEILKMSPIEAKRYENLKTSSFLKYFQYSEEIWPLNPKSVFYDYIYISAVKQNFTNEELKKIFSYIWFTDLYFNPKKSINTQARSIAIVKLLLETHGEIPDFSKDDFIEWHKNYVIQ